MDFVINILALAIFTFWVIGMYEVGRKFLHRNVIHTWKQWLYVPLVLAFYLAFFMTKGDSDNGMPQPTLSTDIFLKIFIPTILALFYGWCKRKK